MMTDSLYSALSGILGALTSERNVVGVGSAIILPLAKRAIIRELKDRREEGVNDEEECWTL